MKLLFAESREELIKHIDSLIDGESCEIYWYLNTGGCMALRFNLSKEYARYRYTIMRGPKAGQVELCDRGANFGKDLKFKNPNSNWAVRKQQIIKNIQRLPRYCL